MISQALIKAGVNPNSSRVIIAVSAATQKGLESLLSETTRVYFGFGNIEAIVAAPVYAMDEHYYLIHPDGRYVVGDMGNYTRPV